jgi:prepilin-type N-terminal cleavage/methylation domain-containing protein
MKTKNKKAGFTLLELMIGMALTVILLYAVVQVFRDATNTNALVVQAADMTDNLRAGLNYIQQDLQQAGEGIPIGGINIPYTSNGSSTSPCGTTAAIVRPELGGTTTFPPCNSTLPAVEPGNELGPAITAPDATAGTVANPNSITDEITMLYADHQSPNGLNNQTIYSTSATSSNPCPNGSISLSGTTLTVTFDSNCIVLTSSPYTTINVGDLIMLTNTNQPSGALLTVTAVSGNTLTFATGDAFKLNGRTEGSGTVQYLENASGSCTATTASTSCFPVPTTATRVFMISYYLDNVSAPPFVRLIRQVNLNSAIPVGETLENLQFTYNFVDGVNNPSNQSTVPSGDSESEIRSVNVYLGARSSYEVHQGGTYGFSRNNLMTQVSLRSMAFTQRY